MYPYILEKKVFQEPTINDDGQLIGSGSEAWVQVGRCRDEVAGAGHKISKTDGRIFECNYTIYAPLSTSTIQEGVLIRVLDKNSNVRLEKEVLRFTRDYFHCRIWV